MKRSLIIDDNSANRQLLVELLHGQTECEEADTGHAGLQKFIAALSTIPFDLVLLDIGMPDMNGLSVLFEIRNLEKISGKNPSQQTPVIIITTHKKLSSEAYRLGCNDYLTKPIDPDALTETIKKIFNH